MPNYNPVSFNVFAKIPRIASISLRRRRAPRFSARRANFGFLRLTHYFRLAEKIQILRRIFELFSLATNTRFQVLRIGTQSINQVLLADLERIAAEAADIGCRNSQVACFRVFPGFINRKADPHNAGRLSLQVFQLVNAGNLAGKNRFGFIALIIDIRLHVFHELGTRRSAGAGIAALNEEKKTGGKKQIWK